MTRASSTSRESLKQDAGTSHVNEFTAKAEDNEENEASDTDDATVTFTDVAPTIEVTKTPDPDSLPETGGDVTYTFTVENESAESVEITELSDDQFGTLTGDADCEVGTVLAASGQAGDSCEFTQTESLKQDAGTSHVNEFTAKAEDNEGTEATDKDDATVRFTDVAPTLEVTKDADKALVPESGGDVTYTFTVENQSSESVTITELSDDQFGTLAGDADCEVGTVLAPSGQAGDSCEFDQTEALKQDAGTSHVNVFTAKAEDNEGTEASDTDDQTVYFTDVLPTIEVTKTADPTSLPETGGDVTYTFTVENQSPESVEITELSDDQFGTLAGDADCEVGTVLAAAGQPGDSCEFTQTESLEQDAGTSHVNVFTAKAEDNEENEASDTDDATVTFTDVAPTIEVEKTADPTSLPETGGDVTYTFTVENK